MPAHFELDVVRRAVHSGEEATPPRAYVPSVGSGEKGTGHRLTQRGAVPDPIILDFRYRPPESGAESLGEGGDQTNGTRAELARELNASIYKAGLSLANESEEEFELTFFCACGCMAEIKRSVHDYVIRGAVLEGHSRPAGLNPR